MKGHCTVARHGLIISDVLPEDKMVEITFCGVYTEKINYGGEYEKNMVIGGIADHNTSVCADYCSCSRKYAGYCGF